MSYIGTNGVPEGENRALKKQKVSEIMKEY